MLLYRGQDWGGGGSAEAGTCLGSGGAAGFLLVGLPASAGPSSLCIIALLGS